jgi:hypothetical protein
LTQGKGIEIDGVAETQHLDPQLFNRTAQPAWSHVEIGGDLFECAVGVGHALTVMDGPYSREWLFCLFLLLKFGC